MARLIFYTTEGCHLCEFAAAMLAAVQAERDVAIEAVDIASDEALVESYGLSIPVVRNPDSGRELNWPFEPEDLLSLF